MSSYRPDAGIPVLTEVIDLPEEPEAAAALPDAAAAAVEPPPALVLRTEEELRRIEQEISERVLQQILDRVDFVLEQRVRDNLADVLQTAVDRLATEIRQGLKITLADVITRAVTQEISRQQTLKK